VCGVAHPAPVLKTPVFPLISADFLAHSSALAMAGHRG